MPSSTEIKPAVTPPPPEFDLLAFWIQHKNKFLLFVALFFLALVSFAVFELVNYRAREAASRDFALAKTGDDFRRVIAQHPGSNAAGNASLLLAAELRKENKLAESTNVLQQFIAKFSSHPMISGAWMSLAVNQEAEGKADDALATYQKVAASFPTSFSAPAALLAEGRIFAAKGKVDDAKRAYETVITQFTGSFFAQQALQENQRLKK